MGYSGGTEGPYSFYAFITDPDGEGMMDLNSLVDSPQRVILIQATDIDNAGQAIAIVVTPQPET